MPLHGPLFMIDGYDIHVFDTPEEAGFALEVLDMKTPGIQLFTGDGKQLALAAQDNRVVVKEDDYIDRPDRLKELLRTHFEKYGSLDRETLDRADLSELVRLWLPAERHK